MAVDIIARAMAASAMGSQDPRIGNLDDLTTIDKSSVVGAINEVDSIAKGANQAIAYNNYEAMITAINAMDEDELNPGQNIMIVTLEVPDLWVNEVMETSSTYTYVDDATVISDLEINGYIQVGYYKLSMLETQKVDLTDYVKNNEVKTLIENDKLNGTTAPTTSTIGYIGQFYLDTATQTEYVCVGISGTPATYTWKKIGGGDFGTYYIKSDEADVSSRAFVFEGKGPGIYFLIGANRRVYMKGETSASSTYAENFDYMIITRKYEDIKANPSSARSENVFGIIYGFGNFNDDTIISCPIIYDRSSSSKLYLSFRNIGKPLTYLDQTIFGAKTFNDTPKCSNTPTANDHLANKKYVDDIVGNIDTILQDLNDGGGVE